MKNKLTHILTILLLTTSLSYCSQEEEQSQNEGLETETPPSDTDELDDAVVLTLLETAIQENNLAEVREILEQNPNAIGRIVANRDPNDHDIIHHGLFEENDAGISVAISVALARAGFATIQELFENAGTTTRNMNLMEAGALPTEGMTDQETIDFINEGIDNNIDAVTTGVLLQNPESLNINWIREELANNGDFSEEMIQYITHLNNLTFNTLVQRARETERLDILQRLEDHGFTIDQ